METNNVYDFDKASFIGKTIQDINIYTDEGRVQLVLVLTDGTSPSIVLDYPAAVPGASKGASPAAVRPNVEQVDTPWDTRSSDKRTAP